MDPLAFTKTFTRTYTVRRVVTHHGIFNPVWRRRKRTSFCFFCGNRFLEGSPIARVTLTSGTTRYFCQDCGDLWANGAPVAEY